MAPNEFGFQEAVDTLDSVPEEYRIAYEQTQDGKFAVKGDLKPMFMSLKSNVTNLASTRKDLQRANGESAQRRQVIKEYEDLLTAQGVSIPEGKKAIEALQEHLTVLANSAKNGTELKVNLDNLKRDFQKQAEAARAEADTKVTKMQKSLDRHLIGDQARAALAKHKGSPELLMPIVASKVKVVPEGEEYVVRVVDTDGTVRYDAKTGNLMTIEGLVSELKASPEYARAFESESKGGSGTPPKAPNNTNVPRQNAGEKTSTQKIAAGLAKNVSRK